MNTSQILEVLRADAFTRPLIQSVSAKDMLTLPIRDPCAYVVNCDNSDKPGSHWVALFIHQRQNESNYFDSMAKPPIPECNSLLNLCSSKKYIDVPLQEMTMVCGQFCIMFLLLRARGYSFEKTIHMLSHKDNDALMYILFRNTFPSLPFHL